jgi:hypothetical protein
MLYDDTRHREDDTVEFLRRLAEFLESELVIKSISHTKLRYPVGATQWRVDPDGTVTHWWFEGGHVSKNTFFPDGPDEPEPGWRKSTPDTVPVRRDVLEDLVQAATAVRENRGEDPEATSYALVDLEACFEDLPPGIAAEA